jgi:hypothetical protein
MSTGTGDAQIRSLGSAKVHFKQSERGVRTCLTGFRGLTRDCYSA